MDRDEFNFEPQLKGMQIVTFALTMGVVIFLGIALFMVYGQRGGQGLSPVETPLLTYLAGFVAISNIVLSIFVPRLVVRNGLKQIVAQSPGAPGLAGAGDAERLLALRQTSQIIGQALLEGMGFLALISFLIEGQLAALVLGGMAILFLLATFPTRQRVADWLEQQRNLLEDLRRTNNP